MPPAYCVVAATNLSKRSKIPRADIIEKAKASLGDGGIRKNQSGTLVGSEFLIATRLPTNLKARPSGYCT